MRLAVSHRLIRNRMVCDLTVQWTYAGAGSRGQDETVNTEDLLYLLATFGRAAPAEMCDADTPPPPPSGAECRDEESQTTRDYLFCALRDHVEAQVAAAGAGDQASTPLLETCTANLDAATADLAAAQASFASTVSQCVETNAALQSALTAEHELTVAALYTNCNATLDDALATAQDDCIAATSALQASLETEHSSALTVMEMDCHAELEVGAASHAAAVADLEAQLVAAEAEKQQELEALRVEYEQRLAALHCSNPVVPFADVNGDTTFGGAGLTVSCHEGYEPTGEAVFLCTACVALIGN